MDDVEGPDELRFSLRLNSPPKNELTVQELDIVFFQDVVAIQIETSNAPSRKLTGNYEFHHSIISSIYIYNMNHIISYNII